MHKVLFCLSLLCLVSCQATKHIESAHSGPASVSGPDTAGLNYQPVAAKRWELVHTAIDITFDLLRRSAPATAQLTLHPYFYMQDSVALDAKSMRILSVSDGSRQSLPYTYDGSKLCIKLPRWYQKTDTLQLAVTYIALPYASEAVGGKAITEDRGLYFINADHFEPYQPVQIWTQGETQANSHWFPTFDHPNFRSTFRITMHVPDSFSTLSNGTLVKSVAEENHLRADTWVQDLPIPPYLAMMAAGNFAIARDSWKGKEVSYYVPQAYGPYAKAIFRNTPEMIDFFSGILKMPYPWDKYSQVIGYDYVSGAMENVSASLFGAFNLKDTRQLADDNNDYIVSHELFHQWFGDYVTCASWSQITLNESFADFSEKLWAEHKYGKDEAQIERLGSMKRYLEQAAYSDPPLVRFYYKEPDDVFDRVSYSKGGWILQYLRMLAGDTAFFDALHLYLTRNALHSAEVSQLRLCFEAVTGQDWNWFFDEWYYRGGHPVLDVSYVYDDAGKTVTAVVKQVQPSGLYRLPLKAQIIRGNRLETVDWLITQQTAQFTYPYNGTEKPVIIPDAGHWLPGAVIDHKDMPQWQVQFRTATLAAARDTSSRRAWSANAGFPHLDSVDLMSRYDALLGMFPDKDKTAVAAFLKEALQDKSFFIRRTALDLLSRLQPVRAADWKPVLIKLATGDPDSKVSAAALAWLGDNHAAEYATTYELAADDSSYLVAAAALKALDEVDHHRAELKVAELKEKNRFSALWQTTAGDVLARDGKSADYAFYENNMLRFFEGDRMMFMSSFAGYLSGLNDGELYEKGLELMHRQAVKEGPGSRFQIGMFRNIYEMYLAADKKSRVASDKKQKALWRARSDKAAGMWNAYKQTALHNEALQKQIEAIEKGPGR